MPKAQEHIKENILKAAKPLLLGEGGSKLTLRAVANSCGIAVGTVYNYFASKEQLMAEIILEDWLLYLHTIQQYCASAQALGEALCFCTRSIQTFARPYESLWRGYGNGGSLRGRMPQWHGILIDQLCRCLLPCCEKEGRFCSLKERRFLSENLLLCALDSSLSIEDFVQIINKNL